MLDPLREFDANFLSGLANAEDVWRIRTVALACKFFTSELWLSGKKDVPSCTLIIAEHVVIVCGTERRRHVWELRFFRQEEIANGSHLGDLQSFRHLDCGFELSISSLFQGFSREFNRKLRHDTVVLQHPSLPR